tara:strand:- start:356 stop:1255 length:900 start_codon:yes stop_codon:yes gene_type:complete
MEYCGDCQGAPNTGVAQCASVIKKTVGLFMVRRIADDGTANTIDLSVSSLIDVDTYVNHADPSKRWYPIMDLKGVSIPKSETKYKTYSDDSKDKTSDGIYSFEGTLGSGQPAGLVKNLDKAGCSDMAIFGVTISGSLYGEFVGTDLYPIQINAFDPAGVFATDENNAEIMIKFDLDNEFQYGRLRQIQVTNFTYNPSLAAGLKNVNITYTTAASLTSTVSITNDYGAGFATQNVHGLVLADFLLENVTTGLPVAITTVTETPNTNYVLDYASQTAGNILKLSTVINTKKYEGSATKEVA